ncbi:small integral membrane protein 1 [Suncus etruscus]|uniref:small integral membrane protein 1 n=1 Tax=Suncus etruscus TaxID=109475 RepID=UPI00210F7BE2|nr:small integral membrane protein 1 [Suncus etruscus]
MQAPDSSVQYCRWEPGSQAGATMDTESSTGGAPSWHGLLRAGAPPPGPPLRVSGRLRVALKALIVLVLGWVVFILGYVTGYYVHKCK